MYIFCLLFVDLLIILPTCSRTDLRLNVVLISLLQMKLEVFIFHGNINLICMEKRYCYSLNIINIYKRNSFLLLFSKYQKWRHIKQALSLNICKKCVKRQLETKLVCV